MKLGRFCLHNGRMNRLILTISLGLVAACTNPGTVGAPPEGPVSEEPGLGGPLPEDACGASGYQGLVGKNLAAVTLPDDLNARVLRPGQVVTMEYLPERMNIDVDKTGAIRSIRCG